MIFRLLDQKPKDWESGGFNRFNRTPVLAQLRTTPQFFHHSFEFTDQRLKNPANL